MKKYLPIIFSAILIICTFTGCAGQRNLNTPVATEESENMQDNSFSEEDYQKLLALQFDGYMNMTITNYRNCVAELTDTAEYKELLERFSKSETLYELKDTNETASFLFNILPLAGDEWKSRSYTGEVTGADNARLEYSFTLTVLDADRLMIKDYNDVRLSVIETMQVILMNQVKEELRNDAAMQAYIQAYVNDFLPYMQTSELSVAIEFAYFPSQAAEEEQQGSELDNRGELETRRYSNGTKDDYHSLLALKTPDYQDMSIADFNSALLEWANEDHERMERIDEDIKWNDFPVTLTAEELYFVKMTVFLSSMENGKAIQSIYTGTEPYSPYYGEYLPEKITIRDAARCSLYYQFSYSISEAEAVTVGVRDRQIEGMINAVQTFWSDTDIKSALKMNEGDIVEELEKIAAAYSTDHITININKEKIHWERMDERAFVNPTVSPNASAAYEKLIVYKTEDYGQQSVADFNAALASTPDELTEFLAAEADVISTISPDDENYDFFTTTMSFSDHELYCEHMGEELTFFVDLSKQSRLCDYFDEDGEPVYGFACFVELNVPYSINEPKLVTVAERDNILLTFKEEMQNYLNSLSEAEIAGGNIKKMLIDKSAELANSLSNKNMSLSPCEIYMIDIFGSQ